MQEFTGLEYIKIDVANTFGNDKDTWQERLHWFDMNKRDLPDIVSDTLIAHEEAQRSLRPGQALELVKAREELAEEPFMFAKAVEAFKRAERGDSIGHAVYLDATASGIQIMAALSGCMETAKAVNMIDPSVREDLYGWVVNGMNNILEPQDWVNRKMIKKPTMTH